jgi:hypothetical protein
MEVEDREKDRNSFFGESTNFFRIENWFPVLEQYTFATSYLTASKQELDLIQNLSQSIYSRMLYEGFLKQEVDPSYVQCNDWDAEYFDRVQQEAMISADELNLLQGLEERFDRLLARQFPNGRGVFVKLSTRSPKDAGLYTACFKPLLEEQMVRVAAELEADQSFPFSPDLDVVGMTAHTRAMIYSLRVRTGHEAVRLLLRSQRASDDVTMMKLLRSGPSLSDKSATNTNASTSTNELAERGEIEKAAVVVEEDDPDTYNIVVRSWCDELVPELEFRCFIFARKFTSCTQYYPDCYVPKLAKNVRDLEFRLKDFVEIKILPLIPISILNLTIDVAFSLDFAKMWLVEINPPPPSAGTSLLGAWEIIENQRIMRGEGDRDFTLCVLNELPLSSLDEVPQQTLDVIEKFKRKQRANTRCIICRFIALVAFVVAATYSK